MPSTTEPPKTAAVSKADVKAMERISRLRNLGIIAHIDAGKTTLSERILFYTQKIHRMGEVHDGTATMDFMPEEQERGITIMAACTSSEWNGHTLNLIDTPGHVDFTIEVERSLRVLDGAVGVFCAVGGVEPQSETVWKQSEQFKVPKLAFINKMDRPGANFTSTLEALKIRLNANPLPITIPIGEEENFEAIIDLITEQRIDFDQDSQGSDFTLKALSSDERELADYWREILLVGIAEADDLFMEQYLGEVYGQDDIHAALRRITLSRSAIPVFAGSALKNIGVQPLLDGITRYLPSPLDIPPVSALLADNETPTQIPFDRNGPAIALVFKVMLEAGRRLSLLRLYSGKIKEGDALRNTSRKTDERISRIFRLHADRRDQLDEAEAGDIIAVMGLKAVSTGDTLAAPGHPVILESVLGYQPVISMALEPKNADEGKILDEALERFALEDPTVSIAIDEGSGHRVISGMGELHLEVIQERIRREYQISPRGGLPQVVLRETIAATGSAHGVFDRELGSIHHHGDITLTIAPRKRGEGNEITFATALLPDANNKKAPPPVPKNLLDETRQGVEDSLLSGPATGFPVQDVHVTITDIVRQEGVTTPGGCHMAAGIALREALLQAGPLTLEPLMRVEINVPEEGLGATINLFTTVGGKIDDVSDRTGMKIITGQAPMRRLFGFSTSLRSATQGRAGLIMQFETFDAS